MEANFAFTLWSNTFRPSLFFTEDIEDFIKIEATLNNNVYTPEGVMRNITKLPIHNCNEQDAFFELDENQKDAT